MKFKVDENVPVRCVEQLRQAGHDALSVSDQGLLAHEINGSPECVARKGGCL